MNKPLSALLFLFVTVFATGQTHTYQPMAPNTYQLEGGSLRIVYSTTSGDGRPHLTYQDDSQTLSFSGSEIRRTKTEIGTLVTVTTHMTVDSGSTSFALLVPRVNLSDASSRVTIHTVGITTAHKFSVLPAANRGQIDNYTTTELSGTASVAVF